MNIIDRTKAAFTSFISNGNDGLTELLTYKSSYFPDSQWEPYNPDSLVQKKGLDIYRKMLRDDQVKAVMAIKINSILAPGYKFVEGSNDKQDVEIKEFIEYCLTDGIEFSFKHSLLQILTALPFGFSVTEKIYQKYDKGKFAGKIGFKRLKTRPPHSFEFHIDEFGNLTTLKQHQSKGDKDFLKNDLKYFIIYSYDSENAAFGNLYGISDLRSAYRSWFSKDIIIRFMNIFIERFGMGIMVVKYPKGGLGKNERDDLDTIIKNIQSKTGFKIPESVVVDILESKQKGQSIHLPTIDYYDRAIARSLLVPDKLGFTASEGGSYNLGENQFNLYFQILSNIQSDLEELVNDQIIPDLVDLNFANVSVYPKFKFNAMTQKDKYKLMERFIQAYDKGIIEATEDDEEFIREELDFPSKTNESVVKERKAVSNPFSIPSIESQEKEDKKSIKPKVKVDSDIEAEEAEEFKKKFQLSRLPNQYEKKCNFEKVKETLKSKEYEHGLEIGKVVEKIKENIVNMIIKSKLIDNKDYEMVDKIRLDYIADLRLAFGQMLRDGYKTGQKTGWDEVKPKQYAKQTWNKLPPKEALDFFNQKKFYLAGTERDYILKNVKALLYDGIKIGKSQQDVMYNLENFFDEYKVEQAMPNGETVPIEEIPGRIETIVRTNMNDAYNQGRLESFEDPDVKDFIVAYQYSAIMDDRVTDICAELDGMIYKTNNPIWDNITPPNHFNCRSTFVPILADEGWDGVESELPDMNLLSEGFGK